MPACSFVSGVSLVATEHALTNKNQHEDNFICISERMFIEHNEKQCERRNTAGIRSNERALCSISESLLINQ